jgi:hypothetical protein
MSSSFRFQHNDGEITLTEEDIPSQPILVLIDLNTASRMAYSKYTDSLSRTNSAKNRNLANWAYRWVLLSEHYILQSLQGQACYIEQGMLQLVSAQDSLHANIARLQLMADELRNTVEDQAARLQQVNDSRAIHQMLGC